MDSLRSPSTWRYLGRVAFHTDPDHRCLPPLDDPDAVRAWSDGYRIAWCAWHNRLPTSPLDRLALETDLQRALQGDHWHDDGDGAGEHRPLGHLH